MISKKVNDNKIMSVSETVALIEKGKTLVIFGEESQISSLPIGNWIAGTSPYFYVKNENGRMDKTSLMVSDFSDYVIASKSETYTTETLDKITENNYENGFTFLIIPALKPIHLKFALESPEYKNLFDNPLIGVIAGVDLTEFAAGRVSKIINGKDKKVLENEAVALHCQLPAHQVARMEIINAFEPSKKHIIEVFEDTFTINDCLIDGNKTNLYDFIMANNMDLVHPLVCDYSGATINVSFQRLDEASKSVIFYAPLFKGKQYSQAKKLDNYADIFNNKIKTKAALEPSLIYNCNCILNYLYADLEHNHIGFSGAAAFGEIGYNLLNQTFTYLSIDE